MLLDFVRSPRCLKAKFGYKVLSGSRRASCDGAGAFGRRSE